MIKYSSYKEIKEKENELYLKLKKERKEFNRFALDETDAVILVRHWNESIQKYGVFTI